MSLTRTLIAWHAAALALLARVLPAPWAKRLGRFASNMFRAARGEPAR